MTRTTDSRANGAPAPKRAFLASLRNATCIMVPEHLRPNSFVTPPKSPALPKEGRVPAPLGQMRERRARNAEAYFVYVAGAGGRSLTKQMVRRRRRFVRGWGGLANIKADARPTKLARSRWTRRGEASAHCQAICKCFSQGRFETARMRLRSAASKRRASAETATRIVLSSICAQRKVVLERCVCA